MIEQLASGDVVAYLATRGIELDADATEVRPLTGGVSSLVFGVYAPDSTFVVKQALERLLVAEEWLADPTRSLVEADALAVANELAPSHTPTLIDADPVRCVVTITHAPPGWHDWKQDLLAGHVDPTIAARLGSFLGGWHAGTAELGITGMFSDPAPFGDLRVDPYYRTTARRHPDIAALIDGAADALGERSRSRCLVHGDFSPKNILVGPKDVLVGEAGFWVIDFEVAHRGDPTFDVAFLLHHLLLKGVHRHEDAEAFGAAAAEFVTGYAAASIVQLGRPDLAYVFRHVGCLALARIDGKSTVSYLTAAGQTAARSVARSLIVDPPDTVGAAWSRLISIAGRTPHPPRTGDEHVSHDIEITDVRAWSAFDSRGTPTVACAVRVSNGGEGVAIVPSGASTGRHEAHELRDGGAAFAGRGVSRAVDNVNDTIRRLLVGGDARDQVAIDRMLWDLDGTPSLAVIGANAVLATTLAVALAVADGDREPLYRALLGGAQPLLPLPMVNIVSGGAHAAGAVDIQDVLVVPVGASSFAESMAWAWEVRRATEELLRAEGMGLVVSLVADEGGIAAEFDSNAHAIESVVGGIEAAGLRPGVDVAVAIDVAANQLQTDREGVYRLARERRDIDTADFVDLVVSWCRDYPIVSVEDPLAEDDWDGWQAVSAALVDRVQVLGDDLLVTDEARLATAVERDVANAILIKPNQAGSLEAAARAVRAARAVGYSTIVSARSGDTEDSWLADLAVGWRAGQIKVGSMMRSERLAKYNRLLRIETVEGSAARFAGAPALAGRRPTA